MRAHRFAGLHRYGGVDDAPEDFFFEFESPLTIIEGQNGSGKTSLLSAISWCLTGAIYRSQRPPESGSGRVPVSLRRDEGGLAEGDEMSDALKSNEMAPITPLPSQAVIRHLRGSPLPLETWVELVFEDPDKGVLPPIRRTLRRSNRGAITEDQPNLSGLGLDPIAIEIGTMIPGQLPYIRVGEKSDLGMAVTALTGLSPLKDLARHAARSQIRLKRELPKECEEKLDSLASEYGQRLKELNDHTQNRPRLQSDFDISNIEDPRVLEHIKQWELNVSAVQSEQLQQARELLGDDFDPHNSAVLTDLKESIGPAIGELQSKMLARLPSAQRLARLRRLSEDEIQSVQSSLERIVSEAHLLNDSAEKPERAARERLYARIAAWIREEDDRSKSLEICPVCLSELSGRSDPITGEMIATHIQHCMEHPTDVLDKTIPVWANTALSTLRADLPESIRTELDTELPQGPAALLAELFTSEPFDSPNLKGSLAPLQDAAGRLWETHKARLPPFTEPQIPELPLRIVDGKPSLVEALRRATRALAFARWSNSNSADCEYISTKIIGTSEQRHASREPTLPKNWPLLEQLRRLQEIVDETKPATITIEKLNQLEQTAKEYRATEGRIEAYRNTAERLGPLTRLGDLVAEQTDQLIQMLSTEMTEWRRRLYLPAVKGAPRPSDARVLPGGRLELDAEQDGVSVPGQHVINASDLRATLIAFVISFWEHLRKSRGGLSMFLLDDPHELLDRNNRRRLASALVELADRGARLIVTTNEPHFAADCLAKAKAELTEDAEHLLIYPLGGARDCIELGEDRESIQKKLRRLQSRVHENDDTVARELVSSTRVYCEQKLASFFDYADSGLTGKASLSDLLNEVRSRHRRGREPFAGHAFAILFRLLDSRKGKELIDLLNRSHHARRDEISYGEVSHLSNELGQLIGIMNELHEEFERWRRREWVEERIARPVAPIGLSLPDTQIPIFTDLAAFSSGVMADGYGEAEEYLDLAIENKFVAFYRLNTHNFGFAAPYGAVVLVDLEDDHPEDGRLVVALHGDSVLARRLYRTDANPRYVCLASEAENPVERPPSLLVRMETIRLLKVVGVFFEAGGDLLRSRDEAVQLDEAGLLRSAEAAFRVVGDSALPLALPDQFVLGGRSLAPSELAAARGKIVALSTTEGCVLKRVGESLPGAEHVRQFESIGGRTIGSRATSVIARTEDLEDGFAALPLVQSIRVVLGVLYPRVAESGS